MSPVALKGENRRGKTALFLLACAWAGMAPHMLDSSKAFLPSIILASYLGGYGLLTVLRNRNDLDAKNQQIYLEEIKNSIHRSSLPTIDILIAARDEETVISRLVERLAALQYPSEKLSIWIVDDGSQDNTPNLLKALKERYSNLNVINRSRNAGGGKSGALNDALEHSNGEWLLVLDADAQLQDDALERLVSFAKKGGWSAVQLRKAVINAHQNVLTRCQAMEMAMDAVIQRGRLLSNGVVELRGNGQLLNRKSLEKCGGFNEATVTDDLDLSFRLLISGALTGILWNPPVHEEAVETFSALWRQRQRWAEGGLQRFFDYWTDLMSNRVSLSKKNDLACFFLLQYALPIVSFVDLVATLLTNSIPAYFPLSIVAFSVSGFAYWRGCNAYSEGPLLPSPKPFLLFIAIIYLVHWFIVIPWVALKMALLPKKLIWVKTSHQG